MPLIRKAQPDFREVHTDEVLTSISVAYLPDLNAELISGSAFPVVSVLRASDKYRVYDKEDFNKAQARKRAPGTESHGSGYRVGSDVYSTEVFAFHKDVDDWTRPNADGVLDPDRDATLLVTRSLLLTRELEWVNKFFKTGVWTGQADQTGVGASPGANQFLQWNDAGSDPIADIRKARLSIKRSTGFRPNTLVLQEEVYETLREHPDIVDRVKYTQRALGDALGADVLAAALGVSRILVLGTVHATGIEPGESMGFMAGKHAWLGYVAPRPGLLVPSAGYIFSWRIPNVTQGVDNVAIERIRMPHLKSDRIEGNMAWDMKVVGADLGAFFSTCIA